MIKTLVGLHDKEGPEYQEWLDKWVAAAIKMKGEGVGGNSSSG